MKEQEKIKAIAEFDGVEFKSQWEFAHYDVSYSKPYLTSRDAIVPVIEKQTDDIKGEISDWLMTRAEWLITATPPQLCEALLRATGKWKD
jgi:hypothetical protein